MSGAGPGYLDFGPARSPRARRDHRHTRQAPDLRLRQRHRTDRTTVLAWTQQRGVDWHYIAPGKPTQNAFIESFNGRLRDELLNETLFSSLARARLLLEAWRADYNQNAPVSRPRKHPAGRVCREDHACAGGSLNQ